MMSWPVLFAQYLVMSLDGLTTGIFFELLLRKKAGAVLKGNSWIRILSFFLLTLLICLPSLILRYKVLPTANLFAYCLGMTWLLRSFYGVSRRKALYLFGCYFMISFVSETFWMLVHPGNTYQALDWTRDAALSVFAAGQLLVFMMKLLFAAVSRLHENGRIRRDPFAAAYACFLVMFIPGLPALDACLSGRGENFFTEAEKFNFVVLYLSAFACASLLLFWSEKREARRVREMNDLIALEEQAGKQTVLEMEESLDLRREYRKHAEKLDFLIRQGSFSEAMEQLAGYSAQNEIISICYCSHPVVNALLCRKAGECAKREIVLETDLQFPRTLQISRLDLCIVTGNLLDNAIEACSRLPDKETRKIEIRARIIQENLVICCRNTCPENPKGTIYGTGLGLQILRELSVRYEGAFDTECRREEGISVFEANLILPERCPDQPQFCKSGAPQRPKQRH